MTGKLIQKLKRKRDEESSTKITTNTNETNAGNSSSVGNNSTNNNASTSSAATVNGNFLNVTSRTVQNNEYYHQDNIKRKRRNQCDTPSDSSSSDESSGSTSSKNSFLIIALQKIIELENDLNEIDNEFKINGLYGNDYDDGEIDEEVSRINGLAKTVGSGSGYEAEALGFAMCARETLLFLQNEGIPENSLLYKALKDRLVGKSDGIPI